MSDPTEAPKTCETCGKRLLPWKAAVPASEADLYCWGRHPAPADEAIDDIDAGRSTVHMSGAEFLRSLGRPFDEEPPE